MSVSDNNCANGHIYTTSSTLEIANQYLSRGFTPIPVKFRSKIPTRTNWPQIRPTHDELHALFGNQQTNVGIVLGTASGGLVDIDIDDQDGLRFAPYFLPQTGMI